ncbi:MAG: hypothetical protein HY726_20285 [Candidatus Rokubacteria bacterium]|nr:hypothetical protein [Candidatus Rokubacteria bacterium]
MKRITVRLVFLAWLVSPETAGAAPGFPWTSFRALAEDRTTHGIYRCDPAQGRNEVVAVVLIRPAEFYRFWTMLKGPDWIAIHYDAEARPDWVWRGTWSGDDLSVTRVSRFDPVAHASACDLLFGAR